MVKTPFEKVFAAYWREVRAVCPVFLRRNLLRELRQRAYLLRREDFACDVATLRVRLGTPKEVVETFEQVYYEDEERLARERYQAINGVLVVVSAVLLIVMVTMVLVYWSNTYTHTHIKYVFHN